jgi:hypothetical protein
VLVARNDQRTIVGGLMVGHDGHRGWVYYGVASCIGRVSENAL